jgi:predicted flap endonuclease-1-like 5' DNA nuclease
MWDQNFKRWLDLVFWWLPKHEAAEQPSAQAAEPAAESAPKQAAPQATEPAADTTLKQAAPDRAATSDRVADDLTVIKGIGPVVQEKLHALGIRTFDDLAAADPETLAEQLKGRQPISQTLVRGWTEAADQQSTARH